MMLGIHAEELRIVRGRMAKALLGGASILRDGKGCWSELSVI